MRLAPETVRDYLVAREVLDPSTPVEATQLGGGVSSVVLDVRTPAERLVVKQPLDTFDVPDTWICKRERVLVEASALHVARSVLRGSVPNVIDLDEEELVIVLEGAHDGWRSWKELLLAGRADAPVAARLGELLSRWHRETSDEDLFARFDDPEIFDEQRADPYYRTTMDRHPELADAMSALLDRLLGSRRCLVHGDWSPKNVLVRPDASGGVHEEAEPPRVWVIDWEITHPGDPSFDVAFMTNHLMLKAIHRPGLHADYARCASVFWTAYGEIADPAFVLAHVGCLMVARVDGKSPAEYLVGADRSTALRVGSGLILDPPSGVDAAFARLG